jgi:hypothetical protein
MRLICAGVVRPSVGGRRRAALRLVGSGVLLLLAAGCSTESPYGARVLTVQGKFEWQDCKQLEAQRASYTKQIGDLQALMDKNAAGGGGSLVNATVHAPVMARLKSERTLIAETMADKNCGSTTAAR